MIGRRRRSGSAVAVGLIVVLALAGCASSGTGEGATTGSGSGMTLTVTDPAPNATVAAPFTVKVTTSVALGPKASGKHHIHVWFDGDEANYKVAESDTIQITSLSSGAHTMHVSLRNADHSSAGVEVSVPIVSNGSSGPPVEDTNPPPGY
jgi:anti-sigma factor RsiW